MYLGRGTPRAPRLLRNARLLHERSIQTLRAGELGLLAAAAQFKDAIRDTVERINTHVSPSRPRCLAMKGVQRLQKPQPTKVRVRRGQSKSAEIPASLPTAFLRRGSFLLSSNMSRSSVELLDKESRCLAGNARTDVVEDAARHGPAARLRHRAPDRKGERPSAISQLWISLSCVAKTGAGRIHRVAMGRFGE